MKRFDCLTVFFVLILGTIPLALLSQSSASLPWVKAYSKEDFQGGSRTWVIEQDSRGYLYFANNDGLLTFDGNYWKKFRLPNGTILRSIYIDENNRVYVGAQGEIGYFEPGISGSLTYTSLNKLVPEGDRNFADVWNTIAMGRSVFFRTTEYIFELRDNRITTHPAPSAWQFLGRTSGGLIAQDKKSGILYYRNNQWLPLSQEALSNVTLSAALPVGGDSTLIATIDNRTFLLRNGKITPMDKTSRQDLYTPSLARIDNHTYVVGSAAGCYIRHIGGQILQHLTTADGLSSNNVTAVFVDRSKNIWIGTDGGIAVIGYNSAVRFIHPLKSSDLVGYSARVFKGGLYLSTSNGVYRAEINRATGSKRLSFGEFSLIKGTDGGESWRLDEINGELLLAHNSGVYVLEGSQAKPVAAGIGSWMFLTMTSAFPINRVFVGTYQGIRELSYGDGVFHDVAQLAGHRDSYRFLAKTENGDIWASHPYRGVYRLHLTAPGRYKTRLYTDKDGLPSAFQNFVFTGRNQNLFATKKGIYEFDIKRDRFIPSQIFKQLKDLEINYLKEDGDGNIWFYSGKRLGVLRLRPAGSNKAGVVTFFPELDGYSAEGFESVYPYDVNNVFIGWGKGFIHLDFEKYLKQDSRPVIVLSEVTAVAEHDSTVFGGFNNRRLGTVILPAAFNAFRFAYSATEYGMQNRTQYSYWLEGYDEKWSAWSTSTVKYYTNLPSGEYRFKVKALDNRNRESEVFFFPFKISAPWYATFWAYACYLTLAIACVWLLLRWQRQVFYRQQQKYEAQMAHLRYVHQLEVEKHERENEVLAKTKELANTKMQLMENTDTLVRLKDELTKLNLKADEDPKDLKPITLLLRDLERNNKNWSQFALHFDALNDGLLTRLKQKHPNISRTDLKLCAYLRLNFSSKEIAQLQNISIRAVEMHRYRLRKKLGLPTELSLSDYLAGI
ncbi:ligand-binding sensor domain-containing protein [Arcticibacter tournemirensis]|uniref:HTH luxR-type domain-containing protein n=1 Tax=Arcticibacter tournemirensis TaxID=699437 RepID=A0A4Q0MA76_9SPHI|nr:two-component regulator propeller domain-containing protein [Arcticibacter tournemirensis]RXF70148.1 hypothetical protein EKH83_09710 [Arcticibacter tournemirensis]